MMLGQTDQVIHYQVMIIFENKCFFCSFVYAGNTIDKRRELWRDLCLHKRMVSNNPWIVLGDFNVGLNLEDHSRSSLGITLGMREFRDCIEKIEVEDLHQSGLHYTWNQRPHASSGILKKLY